MKDDTDIVMRYSDNMCCYNDFYNEQAYILVMAASQTLN